MGKCSGVKRVSVRLCLLEVQLLSSPVSSLGVPSDVCVALESVPVGEKSVLVLGLRVSELLLEGLD